MTFGVAARLVLASFLLLFVAVATVLEPGEPDYQTITYCWSDCASTMEETTTP